MRNVKREYLGFLYSANCVNEFTLGKILLLCTNWTRKNLLFTRVDSTNVSVLHRYFGLEKGKIKNNFVSFNNLKVLQTGNNF